MLIRTQLRIEEEYEEKLKIIAKKQERNMNSQINFIIKQYLSEYEKINGKIEKEEKE